MLSSAISLYETCTYRMTRLHFSTSVCHLPEAELWSSCADCLRLSSLLFTPNLQRKNHLRFSPEYTHSYPQSLSTYYNTNLPQIY